MTTGISDGLEKPHKKCHKQNLLLAYFIILMYKFALTSLLKIIHYKLKKATIPTRHCHLDFLLTVAHGYGVNYSHKYSKVKIPKTKAVNLV